MSNRSCNLTAFVTLKQELNIQCYSIRIVKPKRDIFLIIFLISILMNCFLPPAYAQNIFSPIVTNSLFPTDRRAVGINSIRNRLYLAQNNSSISVINTLTNRLEDVIILPGYTYVIAVNSNTNKIYAVCEVKASPLDKGLMFLAVIDGETNKVVSNIDLQTQASDAPFGLEVDTSKNLIYLLGDNKAGSQLTIFDGNSNDKKGVVGLPGSSSYVFDPNRSTFYFNPELDKIFSLSVGSLSLIDCLIGAALEIVTLGIVKNDCGILGNAVKVEKGADKLAINPSTGTVYATAEGSNLISVVGIGSAAPLPTISVPSVVTANIQVVNPVSDSLYLEGLSGVTYRVIGDTSDAEELYLGGTPALVDPLVNNLYIYKEPFYFVVKEAFVTNGTRSLPLIGDTPFEPSELAKGAITDINTSLDLLEKDTKARRDVNHKIKSLSNKMNKSFSEKGRKCNKSVKLTMEKLNKLDQAVLRQSCSATATGATGIANIINNLPTGFLPTRSSDLPQKQSVGGLPDIGQATEKNCIPDYTAQSYSDLFQSYLKVLQLAVNIDKNSNKVIDVCDY